MVAADAGVLAALGVVEAISFLFVNEEFDSFVQAGLVGFGGIGYFVICNRH